MAKVKGLLVMLPPLIIAIIEFYYLIIQPLNSSTTPQLSSGQYWALAIPVSFGMITLSILATWIGYTMIVTPEPIRLTYEEAYEAAAEELGKSE